MHLPRSIVALAALAMGLAAAGAAEAHHSAAEFDETATVKLVGTIKEWQWTNPHSWIQIVCADSAGVTQEWSIELASPAMLARRGWTLKTLTPGDKVVMTIHPSRQRKSYGSMISVATAEGAPIPTPKAPAANTAPPSTAKP